MRNQSVFSLCCCCAERLFFLCPTFVKSPSNHINKRTECIWLLWQAVTKKPFFCAKSFFWISEHFKNWIRYFQLACLWICSTILTISIKLCVCWNILTHNVFLFIFKASFNLSFNLSFLFSDSKCVCNFYAYCLDKHLH